MTKSNIPYYILLVLLLSTYSCQKDIIGEETDSQISTQSPLISIESIVVGLVSDINGDPLENVNVEHRGETYLTDNNGYFQFEAPSSKINGGYFTFAKDNYFSNYKFFRPIEVGDRHFLRVTMIDQSLTQKLSSTEGGEVIANGGAKVTFSSSSFAKADGSAYSGDVNVYAHWYDPSSNNLAETMPGDLRGTDMEGNRVQLATYGMMGVELRDNEGNELNLATGQTATLTFPIPESLQSAAPESIPTWSYDEERGYWREEGNASIVNNEYIAEVSHFSFWNIDAKFPVVNFCVTVESESEVGIENLTVYLKIISSGITSTGRTNQRGEVCGDIPSDELLRLYILDDCDDIIYSEDIGPYDADTDLENIQLNLTSQNPFTISGQLTCDGMPVVNGYALLTTNDGIRYAVPTDNNGMYTTEILFCSDLKVTVQGIDISESKQAEPEIIESPSNPLIVNQEVCGGELEEYIIYNINGQAAIIGNPSAILVNGQLTIYGEIGENRFRMNFINPTIGNNQPIDSLYANIDDADNSEFLWCYNDTSTPCDPEGASFDEIGMTVGEIVMGSFDTGANPGKTLTGEFKIQLDEVSNFNTLIVDFWEDDNEDGIQDNNESLWSFNSGPQPTVALLPTSPSTILDVNYGEHIYEGLAAGDYQLQVTAPEGYTITNQANNGNNINPSSGLSETITFNGTGLTENIKVGFKPLEIASCYYEVLEPASCSEEGLVAIHINNTDQLTYTLFEDGFQTDTNSFEGGTFELWLRAGTYSYVILGDQGQELCNDDLIVEATQSSCVFFPIYRCENGFPYAITEWDCGDLDTLVSYEWSNGSTEPTPQLLDPGTYSLTVTDINGCTSSGEFEADFSEFLDISGFVWIDNPMFNDNIADPNEERYTGLVIGLYNENGTFMESTISGIEGQYEFKNLEEGDYYIECELPLDFSYLELSASIIDTDDSDIDPLTGRSRIISIGECNRNNAIGIGLKEN